MSEIKYPDITVNIIGQNGNAFCILGICKRAMERAKLPQTEIDSFMSEAMSGGYDHLLATVLAWFVVEQECVLWKIILILKKSLN